MKVLCEGFKQQPVLHDVALSSSWQVVNQRQEAQVHKLIQNNADWYVVAQPRIGSILLLQDKF